MPELKTTVRCSKSPSIEWQDYKNIQESNDRFIVVGRRGTGKSALTYQLEKDWRDKKITTVVIAPTEEEVIGLRAVAGLFGTTVTRIRAGIKIAWRYALLLEISHKLEVHYKTQVEVHRRETLTSHLRAWRKLGDTPIQRLRSCLRATLLESDSPEERIADLARRLDLNRITEDASSVIEKSGHQHGVLIDRLDEGYEPDTIGIGIVDGLIYGLDDIKTCLASNVRGLVFLRDNIFRSIEEEDQDFSRNIEGQVLRLHWDPVELFHFINKRIRLACHIDQESDVKVWNRYVGEELRGMEGFKKCLKLTLYRPRDLLALLNAAHLHARKQDRTNLIAEDLGASAKQISVTRLDDLGKEYSSVFPGIRVLTRLYAGTGPRLTVSAACQIIEEHFGSDPTGELLQFSRILGGPRELVKALYGVGFFGIVEGTGRFIFSHDGKRPDIHHEDDSQLLIHPCYWSALNIAEKELEPDTAADIFDEYEISISSESKELRQRKLGQIISELNTIPLGPEGASQFEDWCKRAIEIAFSKNLTNIQLHPNRSNIQRRDIVATNQGVGGAWKRIREDYKARQVIFEVKNFEHLGIEEYRQVSGYLGREYGSLGFIICRDAVPELSKGRDLDAFREFYSLKSHLIIKLTARLLASLLSKLRNPQKIDEIDLSIQKHLDNHIRLYANGQIDKTKEKRRGKQKT